MVPKVVLEQNITPSFSGSQSDKPNIKRRRVIKSCEQCRQKKLKCDKARPQCSNCMKSQGGGSTGKQTDCIYITPSDDTNIAEIDSKIIELKKQLSILLGKRDTVIQTLDPTDLYLSSCKADKVNKVLNQVFTLAYSPSSESTATSPTITTTVDSHTETDNFLNRQFLIGSVFSSTAYVKKKDPFYKSMLENCESSNKSQTLPLQETIKEKSAKFSTALLESERITRNVSLFSLIRPHLEDFNKVSNLLHHFFQSELFSVYSFLDKREFFLQFYQLYVNVNDIQQVTDSIEQVDYIFLGQLLIILRMSMMSHYNGGEGTHFLQNPHLYINSEVVPLARLCLREIDRSLMSKNYIPYIQLLLLLNYYQMHSPEYGANSADYLQFDITRLFKLCLAVRFNVDPSDDLPQANLIRKIWFHILELNYIKFIYDGDPLLINVEKGYTTELPKLDLTKDEYEQEIIRNIHVRAKYHKLFHKAYALTSNVVSPPPLSELKALFDLILKEIYATDLSGMLKMDANAGINPSSTAKFAKLTKFSTLLDLYILFAAICIPLFYNFKALKNVKESENVLLQTTRLTSSLLILNYFIDSNQLSIKYNLHSQFGHTFHLISRLLECFIRMINIQVILLSRVCYYSTFNINQYTSSFHKVRDVLFKNLKVLLFNIGKMTPEVCSAAKEIHLMNVFKIIKNFGKGEKCTLSKSYLNLLQHNELLKKTTQLDESVCTVIVINLCESQMDTSIELNTEDRGFINELSSSDSNIDLYFENLENSNLNNNSNGTNMIFCSNGANLGEFLSDLTGVHDSANTARHLDNLQF